MVTCILAIDPGTIKCGIAIVSKDDGVLARTIVNVSDVLNTTQLLTARFKPDGVVIGSGTGSNEVVNALKCLPVEVYVVDERLSTQKARARYFRDNPPKGWRRLVPKGLLTPSQPYDDYAAVLLAEEFLRHQKELYR